jgi:predicted metal-dependent phosphoesterase TrpH
MRLIDLHAHTTASDGTLSPIELVRLAKRQGLSVLAVTDHDTLAGIPEALGEGERVGLQIVPGVEVTTYVGDLEIHLLGHFVDPDDSGLADFLAPSRADRVERIRRMIDKLWALGLPLDLEEVLAEATGSSVGRPHLAQVMVKRGYVASVQEAFDRYLATGRAAHVERAGTPASEAIAALKRAGGVPSLAHPGVYGRDEMISQLVEQGLMGLEVQHPDHDGDATFRYERLRLKYGLLAVAGSDYHGTPGLRESSLGRPSLSEWDFDQLAAAAAGLRTIAQR